jgi:NAD(P)-dependent dehydrogenase (short-subunit alcohol dehydrogenase family)
VADVHGKTCVLTGTTSGIGRAAALALAARRAHLVLVARDPGRGQAVIEEILAVPGNGGAELVLADLSSQAAVRQAAATILERCPRIDVLINNAGAIFWSRQLTADGLEATFAVNHLTYYLLTLLLLDRIKASAPARIVNVASRAHRRATGIPFDDLRADRGYDAWIRYGQSKLANILFTRELARRLARTGVTVNALHPGVVATHFGQAGSGLRRWLLWLARPFQLSPEQAAQAVVYLATSPELEGVTGKYFDRCAEATPWPAAQDDNQARRLWEVSADLIGVGGA